MRSIADSINSCRNTIVRSNSSSQRYQISSKLDSPLFFLPFLCLLFCNTQGYATVTTNTATTIKPTQSLTVSNLFHFFFLFFVLRKKKTKQNKQTIKPLTLTNQHTDRHIKLNQFSLQLSFEDLLETTRNKQKITSFQRPIVFISTPENTLHHQSVQARIEIQNNHSQTNYN